MPWHTPPQRGERSRLRRPGGGKVSQIRSPRRFVLQPASGEERANIVTCSADISGKQEQRCCSKHEKKENRYGHFCVKTHHKQSEHCLSPRVLGRRVRLEQSDPDAPGPGPFGDRGAERAHLLADDVTTTRQILAEVEGPTLLVGH